MRVRKSRNMASCAESPRSAGYKGFESLLVHDAFPLESRVDLVVLDVHPANPLAHRVILG